MFTCARVCPRVLRSCRGCRVAPNEVLSYSHCPLSLEMRKARGEQLVQRGGFRSVEERSGHLGLWEGATGGRRAIETC